MPPDSLSGLLDAAGRPTAPFFSLLSLLGHGAAVPPAASVSDLLALLVPLYLRKPGTERWSLAPPRGP